MTLGLCDACARLKRLREDGTVTTHFLAMPVSNRAIHSVQERTARVRRRCPGSGKAPRASRQ